MHKLPIREQYALAYRLIRLRVCIDEMSEWNVGKRYQSFGVGRSAFEAAMDTVFNAQRQPSGWQVWQREADFYGARQRYNLMRQRLERIAAPSNLSIKGE